MELNDEGWGVWGGEAPTGGRRPVLLKRATGVDSVNSVNSVNSVDFQLSIIHRVGLIFDRVSYANRLITGDRVAAIRLGR